MAFDQEGNLLVPFRTWRNGITEQAAEALTELFQYNIPQRWSIAPVSYTHLDVYKRQVLHMRMRRWNSRSEWITVCILQL